MAAVADRHEIAIPAKALLDWSRIRPVAENHHLRARRNFLKTLLWQSQLDLPSAYPAKKFGPGPALHWTA